MEKFWSLIPINLVSLPFLSQIKNWTGKMSEKDIPVLVSGLQAQANYLVTGNLKDFPKAAAGMKIVSPRNFLSAYARQVLAFKSS